MHRLLIFIIALGTLPALADSAGVKLARQVWIPDSWNQPEFAGGGAGRKASFRGSSPESFVSREIGVALKLKSATVHINREANVSRPATLKFTDGRVIKLGENKIVKVGKDRYRVLGEHGRYFYLQQLKSRRYWRFRKEGASQSSGD
jgi:hypothetical protein